MSNGSEVLTAIYEALEETECSLETTQRILIFILADVINQMAAPASPKKYRNEAIEFLKSAIAFQNDHPQYIIH